MENDFSKFTWEEAISWVELEAKKIIEGKNQAGGNGHHIEVKTYERHS